MNITIVGAGNIGTQLAVHCAAKGHSVCIYSRKYRQIANELSIVDEHGALLLRGTLRCATDDPHTAFANADLVFVTVPAFCMKDSADEMTPHLKTGAKIGLVPGSGGGEFAFKAALDKGCVVFGLQRVPSVARLVEYGKCVCASGYRATLHAAALPAVRSADCARLVEELIGIPCVAMPNYLNLTLTPSNPILHTTRLKTIFAAYAPGMYYERLPLFYEQWDDASSELLLRCDAEVQRLCAALPEFDLSYVKSLREHYESDTAQALTRKITSIPAFKGLKTPAIETEHGWIPDLSSRYFTADFSYGLTILIQMADLLQVEVPHMKATQAWYDAIKTEQNAFSFAAYGIHSKRELLAFYR